MTYYFDFILKNAMLRGVIDLRRYNTWIQAAAAQYNSICAKVSNPKSISVVTNKDNLEIMLKSHNKLNPKYVGIALKLFSQILVQQFGALLWCTTSDPRKLFVTV